MYLVEIQQADRRHTVGLFTEEKDAVQWIESIPYVQKQVDTFDQQQFTAYTMRYEDLPLYEEMVWQASRYPLTKYMFTPDGGDIELFIWPQLPVMNEAEGLTEGATQVDAYIVPNEEAERYIEAREEIRQAVTEHCEKLGKHVEAGGIGSQDGEYLLVEGRFFMHLDASAVSEWQKKASVKQFIEELEN